MATVAASAARGRGEDMSRYDSSSRSGLSTWGVLLIVFVVLKLIGVINWGWGWVLAPLWIPVVIVIIGFLISLISD